MAAPSQPQLPQPQPPQAPPQPPLMGPGGPSGPGTGPGGQQAAVGAPPLTAGPAPSGMQVAAQAQDFDPVQRFRLLLPQLKESLQVSGLRGPWCAAGSIFPVGAPRLAAFREL